MPKTEQKKNIFWKIKEFFQKFQKQDQYDDFETITGYGTIEGLCGIKCRHTFMPFYKGMTNNQPQYDSGENRKRYDLEQKKRAAERKIRETNKEYENAKHARKEAEECGLKDLADQLNDMERQIKQKFDRQYSEYSRFCGQNGLKKSDERIYSGKETYTGYNDWMKKNVAKSSLNSNIINPTEPKEEINVHTVGKIDKDIDWKYKL